MEITILKKRTFFFFFFSFSNSESFTFFLDSFLSSIVEDTIAIITCGVLGLLLGVGCFTDTLIIIIDTVTCSFKCTNIKHLFMIIFLNNKDNQKFRFTMLPKRKWKKKKWNNFNITKETIIPNNNPFIQRSYKSP